MRGVSTISLRLLLVLADSTHEYPLSLILANAVMKIRASAFRSLFKQFVLRIAAANNVGNEIQYFIARHFG